LVGNAIAVAVHSLEGSEGAIVGALGLGAQAQVGAETDLLFLHEGFSNSGFPGAVVAANVFPKFAIDAADAKQFPPGMGELLDEDTFVRVRG
jgi:hypothetical protein